MFRNANKRECYVEPISKLSAGRAQNFRAMFGIDKSTEMDRVSLSDARKKQRRKIAKKKKERQKKTRGKRKNVDSK